MDFTLIYGIYGKKHHIHVFCVNADKIAVEIWNEMYENKRTHIFTINYKLAVVMQ